jgi:hypothetical protein
VGKGLTFDSGGYNLKAGAGSMIELMKFDMGGSAATLGAARILADVQPAGVEVGLGFMVQGLGFGVEAGGATASRRVPLWGDAGVLYGRMVWVWGDGCARVLVYLRLCERMHMHACLNVWDSSVPFNTHVNTLAHARTRARAHTPTHVQLRSPIDSASPQFHCTIASC